MLSKYGNDASVTSMVDKLDWVIMPIFNVDGYEYTHTRVSVCVIVTFKTHIHFEWSNEWASKCGFHPQTKVRTTLNSIIYQQVTGSAELRMPHC